MVVDLVMAPDFEPLKTVNVSLIVNGLRGVCNGRIVDRIDVEVRGWMED